MLLRLTSHSIAALRASAASMILSTVPMKAASFCETQSSMLTLTSRFFLMRWSKRSSLGRCVARLRNASASKNSESFHGRSVAYTVSWYCVLARS